MRIIFIILVNIIFIFGCQNKTSNESKTSVNNVGKITIPLTQEENSKNLRDAIYKGDENFIKSYINDNKRYNFNGISEDHWFFTNNDLRLFRNTIFAMHGYKFKSKDLQNHFKNFAWYNGTKENVENELNEKEQQLMRIILAMEAYNPPNRDDLAGDWVIPVAGSVESVGFLTLTLKSDGTMSGFANGYWSLEGTTFRTIPYSEKEWMELGFKFGDVEDLRIIVFEYKGELYKATHFFCNYPAIYWYQESKMPSKRSRYWGNWDNTDED